MDKFCGQCGSPLNENGVCPNCTAQQEPGYAQTQVKSTQPVTKKKSTKKAGIIVAIILAFVVVLGLIIGLPQVLKLFGITNGNIATNRTCIVDDGAHKYYPVENKIVDISNDEDPQLVYADEEDSEIVYVPNKHCFLDNTIYGPDPSSDDLYKITLNGIEATKEVWVDSIALYSAAQKESITNDKIAHYIEDLCVCGDYVFFYYDPKMEYWSEESSNAYRLGRISLDGKKIDFLDESIHAASIISDGKWIYYYDNGYTDESINEEVAGIYRMKPNGSHKEKLVDFEASSDELFDLNINEYIKYDNLEIYGDYLYFIDNTEIGKCRVCRINTTGSEKEYITPEGAYHYTVDEENEMIYYSIKSYPIQEIEDTYLYQYSLETGENTKLFELNYLHRYFSINDGYVYLYNAYDITSVSGRRYNIKDGTMEKLKSAEERIDCQIDPSTGRFLNNKFKYSFNWEDEEITDNDTY